MRHDQPTTPFDVEAEELTQQFWGSSKGWVSSEHPTVPRRAERTARRDDTGSLRAIRDGFAALRPQTSPHATGEVRRIRQHGVPDRRPFEPAPGPRREATLGELADGRSDVGGWYDDDLLDDAWPTNTTRHDRLARGAQRFDDVERDEPDVDVPLSPVQPLVDRLGLGAVDPLLVRAGLIVLALVLLVPLALSLRPDRDDSLPGDVVEAPQPVGAAPDPGAPDSAAPELAAPTETALAEPTSTEAAPSAGAVAAPATTQASPAAGTAEAVDTTVAPVADRSMVETADGGEQQTARIDAAAVDVAAERMVPACPQTYTAAAGDSWYRIADAAGVAPRELLAQNNATTKTVILPGDEICLPEGAAMPTPPAPGTTQPTEPSTTVAPTTTAPPTSAPTTTTAPVANLSRSEVQDLIRQTWPADQVEKALAVARRESNFVATADNGWCCVGVFQLYWTAHRGWLDDFGIHQRSDLYDARKNIAAAFHMWETQGWGPWGG